MLSTPPAFNLSQNQTLQFKSVAKISVGRKSESQSSFPFAIHLSMNHTDSLGAKNLFTPLRFRCQQVFFISRKFFRGPVGATRWREGDLCLIFKPASRTFLPSGKISFPVVLSGVASSLARTALCAFSTPPSSIFPQKNLLFCPLPTVHSTNILERHRKCWGFSLPLSSILLSFSARQEPSLSTLAKNKPPLSTSKYQMPQVLQAVPYVMDPCCLSLRPLPITKKEPEGSPVIL